MVHRVALLSLHSSPLAPLGGSGAGGMNLYVRRLSEDLTALGIQADIFTRRTDTRTPEVVQTEGGARLVHLAAGPPSPVPKSVLPLHIPGLAASFEAFERDHRIRYDLLHSHYWISGLTALRVAHRSRVPVVHMFHTLSKVKEFFSNAPDPGDSALRFDGEKRVIEGAAVVVGATAMERRYMERLYGVVPSWFEIIPPGVDLQDFRPHDQDASRRALRLDGDQIILFVGRFDRIKGLEVLLRSLKSVAATTQRRLKLVVVGGHENEHLHPSSRYRHVVDKLGVTEMVEFRGAESQSKLPLYYSAADVCAVPSAYESFGMVAVEAMACATPVVAFRVGGLETTIRDGQTGFLARAGNTSEFTAKLLEALRSDRLETIGRQARIAVERYRWDLIARRTVELYDTVERMHRCSPLRAVGH